jgi:hypothetical protein
MPTRGGSTPPMAPAKLREEATRARRLAAAMPDIADQRLLNELSDEL